MRCPDGHESVSTDYCDVCGIAMAPAGSPAATTPDATPAPATTEAAAATAECPSCGVANVPDALFCEACGYDFTTGAMPQPLAAPEAAGAAGSAGSAAAGAVSGAVPNAAPTSTPSSAPGLHGWVAEIWIDPDWYAAQESTDPLPSPGLPHVVRLAHTSVLIGRASRSRGIDPDIDLSSDNGISRRHAQLTTDGTRWWVEDLGSSNGTYVGSTTEPLPTTGVPAGEKREIAADDRVYLGAWTRIIVRKAADGEL